MQWGLSKSAVKPLALAMGSVKAELFEIPRQKLLSILDIISVDTLEKICRVLSCDVGDIMEMDFSDTLGGQK